MVNYVANCVNSRPEFSIRLSTRIRAVYVHFAATQRRKRVRFVSLPGKNGTKAMKCFAFLLMAAGIASAQVASPSDAGMYVQTGSGFTKIIGQIAQFTRTGSRLASTATVGIKSAKANIQLQGPHAQSVVSPQPTFYFIPPKQAAEAGVNAGDLILIRLEEKPQRRQFEIAAAGLFRASAGISLTHQIQLLRSEARPGVYVITPATELQRGEYALYLARGEGMAAYVYDFGVQGAHSAPSLQPSRLTARAVLEGHLLPCSVFVTESKTFASICDLVV